MCSGYNFQIMFSMSRFFLNHFFMSLIILNFSLFAGKHLRNTRANLESLKPRKSSIFRGKDKEIITLITFTFELWQPNALAV